MGISCSCMRAEPRSNPFLTFQFSKSNKYLFRYLPYLKTHLCTSHLPKICKVYLLSLVGPVVIGSRVTMGLRLKDRHSLLFRARKSFGGEGFVSNFMYIGYMTSLVVSKRFWAATYFEPTEFIGSAPVGYGFGGTSRARSSWLGNLSYNSIRWGIRHSRHHHTSKSCQSFSGAVKSGTWAGPFWKAATSP